jgi:hypothetical protein
MKIGIKELRNKRQWRAATGLGEKQFTKLLKVFKVSYEEKYGASVAERQAEIEVTPCLQSEEELLFFTLFSLKSGLTYDLLGLVCGMDGSNAKRNQERGLTVLKETLQSAGYAPKREFESAAEFAEYLKKEKTLLLDGTEQRIQRPGNAEEQKMTYSGKKSQYTESIIDK